MTWAGRRLEHVAGSVSDEWTLASSALREKEWDPSLVLADGSSDKFWKARRSGPWLEAWWGRRGTQGQRAIWAFSGAGAAQLALEDKTQEKRRKGYVDEGGAGASAPQPPADRAPARPTAARSKRRRGVPERRPLGRFHAIRAMAAGGEGGDGD